MPPRTKSTAVLAVVCLLALGLIAPAWAAAPAGPPGAKKPTRTPTPWPTAAPTRTPRPTATATATQKPIVISTPRPDGSVIHLVEAGQAMWSIAMAYQVSVADIYAMNGMNENTVLYPGDKLLVKAAEVRTATPRAATAGPTLDTPTPTQRPTRTLAPSAVNTSTQVALASPTGTPTPQAAAPQPARMDPLLLAIAILTAVGSALLLGGVIFKRR